MSRLLFETGPTKAGFFIEAQISGHILKPILQDLDDLIAAAKRSTPGGVLTNDDTAGLFRRVGSLHGCTPDDVQRWHERRGELMAA